MGPILVLASGQRCGSTLVQRLLTSHPDVMIWGEHGGHLSTILRASSTIRSWNEGMSTPAREQLRTSGHQGWIANVLPEPRVVDDAARAYLLALFAEPAAPCTTWGFKEVRMGFDDARTVRQLFGDTRVVHLTRDPRDVLRSLDRWERGLEWPREYTEIALADWVRVNESFAGADEDWVLSWRYEDLVGGSSGFVEALAQLTGLDPNALDLSVFDRRVDDYPGRSVPPSRAIPSDLRALLDDEGMRRVAAHYGYDLHSC